MSGGCNYSTIQMEVDGHVTTIKAGYISAQSRQSAKLFLQSSELGLPHPSPAGECALPPFAWGGGAHSLAREGVGESHFRRGDIHCGTLYIYMYFVH
jgi:hypothetical protein